MNIEAFDKIQDPEIRDYCYSAYSDKFGIEQSTLLQYANRLKNIKDIVGASTIKEFSSEDRQQSKRHWDKLISNLKNHKTKNTADVYIAALVSFCNVEDVEVPRFVRHQKKASYSMTSKSDDRKSLKSQNIELIIRDFRKIYSADIPLRDKFLCIHTFLCCDRISEVSSSLVSDVKVVTYKGLPYRAVLVRSQKQKKLITRIIPEDVYWDYREEYENTLELGKTTKGVDDYLFPSKSLDNTYLKKPLSSSDIRRIISGYWGYYKGDKSKYYPGVCERVWGRRMWTHIFRHARTNDMLKIWPIEAVQLWRSDSSINTTRIYADEEQIKKQMFESLDKKDVNDWGVK